MSITVAGALKFPDEFLQAVDLDEGKRSRTMTRGGEFYRNQCRAGEIASTVYGAFVHLRNLLSAKNV